jgi:hypothetical protein
MLSWPATSHAHSVLNKEVGGVVTIKARRGENAASFQSGRGVLHSHAADNNK